MTKAVILDTNVLYDIGLNRVRIKSELSRRRCRKVWQYEL